MLSRSVVKRRHRLFHRPRDNIPFHSNQATRIFPLLHSNNLLAKPRNNWKDYQGREAFDEDHPTPVVGSRLNEMTGIHKWSAMDTYLNPQLIQCPSDLPQNEEYVGRRSGFFMNQIGWMKIGGSWKFARSYDDKRRQYAVGTWQERKQTPRFMLAPRVSPSGPRARFEGKLQYSRLRLSKLLWAIDTGRLNPNEVITVYTLRNAGVIGEAEVLWPGFALVASGVTKIPYPLQIELQSATPRAIKLVEEAGGNFTAGYLTASGLHQEMHPEMYPVFPTQDMPEKKAMDSNATNPVKRGYLSRWYEEEGKYAHPEAGRRLAHYVKPPQDRDFPATVEEYELVKHHQKWHLNQPGTGTVLPWHLNQTFDLQKRSTGKI